VDIESKEQAHRLGNAFADMVTTLGGVDKVSPTGSQPATVG
jgi:hypothetical protein